MAALYGNSKHFRSQQALIVAEFCGTKLSVKDGKPPKSDLPVPETPTLVDGQTTVSGSTAVSTYLARGNAQLTGNTDAHKTEVLAWLQVNDTQLCPSVMQFVLPAVSCAAMDPNAFASARDRCHNMLELLNTHMLTRTYLVGERMTLADIAVACTLKAAFENVLEPSHTLRHQNLTRWFMTIVNQPAVKTVLGKVSLCVTEAQHNAGKYKENQAKIAAIAGTSDAAAREESTETDSNSSNAKSNKKKGKKDKKKGAGGGGGGDSKKEEKKSKKKDKKSSECEEEMDEADLAVAQEAPKKDPFAEMPKGTWNFDEFKRVYSNEDTVEKAIPYFWEKFDKENYSIWYCEYKYPKELALVFMSCNLIGGMFQRLDKLNKNAFGSMCLFGKDHDSTISGVWFWRGHELAFELSENWKVDYQSYEWKKLDFDDPKTKTLVNEYLAWEGKFDGKTFNQGKIFK